MRALVRVSVVAVAIAAAGGALAVARVVQRIRLEITPPRLALSPAGPSAGLPGAEEVTFPASDGVPLRGWYVAPADGALVLLGHGHGANREQMAPLAARLVQGGFGVLLFDWRAHGESGGETSTLGQRERLDVEAALAFLEARPEVDTSRLGAVAFSFAGLPVAEVAERDGRLGALVLAGTFSSLEEMLGRDEEGWRAEVAKRAVRAWGISPEAVEPGRALCRLSPRPLLLVYGEEDPIAPPEVGERLLAHACGPARMRVLPGADHRGLPAALAREMGDEIASFFRSALGLAPEGRDQVRP